jgi:hypothetical protein
MKFGGALKIFREFQLAESASDVAEGRARRERLRVNTRCYAEVACVIRDGRGVNWRRDPWVASFTSGGGTVDRLL